VILDEPLSGLDPINSELINQQILEFKTLGKLVIFSTHRMEQAEQICDNVIMISNGKKVLEGNLNSIKQANREGLYFFQTLNCDKALEIFKNNQIEVVEFDLQNKYFKCKINKSEQLSEQLSKILQSLLLEASLQGFGEILPTLGEIFLKYV
jgi:ABC-2 type transport system ATP-binding protein